MSPTDPPAALPVYLDLVAAGDLRGAVGLCVGLVEAGHPAADVVREVLAPAQADVGRRWERAVCSVSAEHAATSITDAALAAVAAAIEEPADAAPVLLLCVEGDWHSVPARMAATLLLLEGWPVRFVGASAPADDVGRYAAELAPVAVAVSCTVASFLAGAARTVEAVHDAGLPVIAGGRGFGSDARRADAIGADHWAPDVADAAACLERWRREGAPTPRRGHAPPGAAAHRRLRAVHAAALAEAYADLLDRLPAMADYDERQRAATRADLSSILDFLAAAVLTDDPTVVTDLLAWLVNVLAARGVPAHVVPPGIAALADALGEVPEGRRLLLAAAEDAGLRPDTADR